MVLILCCLNIHLAMFSLQIFTFLTIFFIVKSEEEMGKGNDEEFKECLGNFTVYFPNTHKFEEDVIGEFYWPHYCQLYKLRFRNWCHSMNDLDKNEKELPLNRTISWSIHRPPKEIESTFSVKYIYISKFYQSEWLQASVVDGFIKMFWVDKRLKWKNNETIQPDSCKKLTNMKGNMSLNNNNSEVIYLHNKNDVWTPYIFFHGQEKHFTDPNHKYNFPVKINSDGNISWWDDFETQGDCEMDFKDFPHDKHDCCIYFYFHETQRNHQIEVHLSKKTWMAWEIIKRTASWKNDDFHLSACFTIKRRSTLIYFQLVLPLAATAFLAILGPLSGSWKIQLFLRIFSIFLLVINLQETTGWHLAGMGQNPPKIVVLYDFYIWVTVIALVISLGLWSTSKVKNRAKPPPGPLGILGYWLNPWMPCTAVKGSQGQDAKSMAVEGEVDVKVDVDYAWQEALIGLNNVVNIVVTVIYILGSIIIGA